LLKWDWVGGGRPRAVPRRAPPTPLPWADSEPRRGIRPRCYSDWAPGPEHWLQVGRLTGSRRRTAVYPPPHSHAPTRTRARARAHHQPEEGTGGAGPAAGPCRPIVRGVLLAGRSAGVAAAGVAGRARHCHCARSGARTHGWALARKQARARVGATVLAARARSPPAKESLRTPAAHANARPSGVTVPPARETEREFEREGESARAWPEGCARTHARTSG
jgi:hypothetical protein